MVATRDPAGCAAPAELSRRFEALFDERSERPRRLGVEHEYGVFEGERQIDFGPVVDRRGFDGERLHPTNSRAYQTASGLLLMADGVVAEAASPPVLLGPEFVGRLEEWGARGRGALEDGQRLVGGSTHLSVEVPAELNEQLCEVYAQTFAPALMLLMDRGDSPGLLIRPRPSRTELCGEFVHGERLRAALAFAAGSVLAIEASLTRGRDAPRLPRAVEVLVEPGRQRHGLYVDRRAFGPDLYKEGRSAELRLRGGGVVSAQRQLEQCWQVAREALRAVRISEADLQSTDSVVSGAVPLPSEVAELDDATRVAGERAPDRHGLVLSPAAPSGFELRAVSATWDSAAFEVTSTEAPSRSAVMSVPERQFESFLDGVGRGEFDEVLSEYLAQPPTNRVLESSGQTVSPGIYDSVSPNPQLLPPDMMGTGPGVMNPQRPGKVEEEDESRVSLPWGWIGAALVALLVGLGAWISLSGDGEENLVGTGGAGGFSTTVPTVVATVAETVAPTLTPTPVPLAVPDGYGDFVGLLRAAGVGDPHIGESLKLAIEDEMGAGTGIYSRSDTTPGNFGDDVDQWDVIPVRSPLHSAARTELVGNTVFECGVDTGEFLTLCSSTVAPLPFPEGDVVVIAEIMVGDVAAQAEQWIYTYYALVAETDGSATNNFIANPPFDWDLLRDTDTWWVLERNPAAWSMDRFNASFGVPSPTAVRAVVRGNTILWLVPASELPPGSTFRTTSFRHDGSFQPAVSGADVIGANPTEPLLAIPELGLRFFEDGAGGEPTPAPTAAPTTEPAASPTATATAEPQATLTATATEQPAVDGEALARQFVVDFEAAHGSGDMDFLFARLDELVLERYGAGAVPRLRRADGWFNR